MTIEIPESETFPLDCPFCGCRSIFEVVTLRPLPHGPLDLDREPKVAVALLCHNGRCKKIIGGVVDRHGRLEDHWPKEAPSKTFHDVPPAIARAAEEAHLCLGHGALRGAVAIARAVVEATAKEKGITTGGVESKIEALHAKGWIRGHIREAAHEVRHLGNEMAHGDFVEQVDQEDAEGVLGLMDEVLFEVFQSPAHTQRIRDEREARQGKTSQP